MTRQSFAVLADGKSRLKIGGKVFVAHGVKGGELLDIIYGIARDGDADSMLVAVCAGLAFGALEEVN